MNGWKSGVLVVTVLAAVGFSFFGIHKAAAQSMDWAQLFGTPFVDHASDATTDRDGNVYVVGATDGKFDGQTRAGGSRDAYLRKFDGSGKEVWTRQFGSIGDDWARAVAVDGEGNILVAGEAAEDIPGQMRVSGFAGAYVRKFGTEGNELWMRHFGVRPFSQANGVAVDRAGNVFLAGQIAGALPGQAGLGSSDAFLRAYDKNGRELWTRQFGTEGIDTASAVAVDGDGKVYVVGESNLTRSFQQFITPFIRKFDGDGSLVWAQDIPTRGFARSTAAAVDNAGNLYLAGWISGTFIGQEQAGKTDAFIGKFNENGEELWTRQFGTNLEDRALGVGVESAGDPYVVGWTRGTFPGQTGLEVQTRLVRQDAFIRKYDGRGNEVWTHQFGTKFPQRATGVTADGSGVYVVGQTAGPLLGQVSSGASDAFLLRLPGGPPRVPPEDTSAATVPGISVEKTPNPDFGVVTIAPKPTQTPLAAATPEAGTNTPAGGSCGLSGGSKAGTGWLMTILLVPGLFLVRRKLSRPS